MLSVPEQHQKKIAIATLKMSDMGAVIMGGMSKESARWLLKSFGWKDAEIDKLEA
jgi:hypothetical protein